LPLLDFRLWAVYWMGYPLKAGHVMTSMA
jgi:hypothetical protein